MSKRGLGKGLNALFGDTQEEYEIALESGKIEANKTEIRLSEIFPNKNQPRKKFDEDALIELKNSIQTHGVITPIVVNRVGDKFQIIAGERRFRASKLAGKETIPAIIMDINEKKVREIALIENLQREDLNIIEVAFGIKELMERYDLTQEEVSVRISKSRSAIANTLRLLSLPSVVIALMQADRLSLGHGKVLAGIDNKERCSELAVKASDGKMTVRELEKIAKAPVVDKKETKPEEQSVYVKDFENTLTDKFSTKVKINGNEEKGKIVIEYFTKDDLERIYQIIKK